MRRSRSRGAFEKAQEALSDAAGMPRPSQLLLLGALASTAAFTPTRATAPTIRRANRHATTPPLLASAPPAEEEVNVGSNLAAGVFSGLVTVIDCAAFTSIVFGPVGLPLTVGLQHGLIGFALMQTVVTRLAGVKYVLAPTSYEVMPFLAKFAALAAAAGATGGSLLATMLAASVLIGLLGSVLVALSAELPVDDVEKLLPPALQAGLFAAIGWSIYLLAFDALGVAFSLSSSMLAPALARLWVPANLLGAGLWLAGRTPVGDSPALFPGFILGVTALVHGVRMATGTTVGAARAAGWLMAEAAGAPATQLWSSFMPSLVRWDVLFSGQGISLLLAACLFGPVVNTVLNYVLIGPLFKTKLSVRRELRAHAAGAAAAAGVGGYSSYVAIANTVIHRKVGATSALSCYTAAAVVALFLMAFPLCGVIGYMPTLVIAAICVYIGVDFLWDNLIEPLIGALTREGGAKSLADFAPVAASWAVLIICVQKNMLLGTSLGIVGFQLANLVQRRRMKAA